MSAKLRFTLAAAIVATVTSAHAATKPIDVYSIWYSSDTTDETTIETFDGCLCSSSTFGSSWGALWGVGPFNLHAPIVLTTAPPNPLQIDTSVQAEINKAIAASLIPAPTATENTIYIVHGPSNVTNNAGDGTHLCYNGVSCGEHGPGVVGAKGYQAALVPLDCPLCGGTLKTATWIGQHELAEAAADEGTATFEVGDKCEASKNLTQLQCCGQSYTIQQLDTPQGPGACQTITATGSMCTCGVVQSACAGDGGACCSGMTCQPWVAKIGDTPSDVCCYDLDQACSSTNDCCGGLACSNGKCACEALGQFCLRDADCCAGVCDPKLQKCVTPQPDAGADASIEAGPDASGADASGADGGVDPGTTDGCGCLAAGARGGGAWPFGLLALALIARRRRQP